MESEELSGIIFDIKELAVYDGPGIRTTVFLKGCPLRCQWCHNPEGLSVRPQIMVNRNACVGCGNCQNTPGCNALADILSGVYCDGGYGKKSAADKCVGCGKCVERCVGGCRTVSGKRMTAGQLCDKLMKASDVYGSDGGVTFSGGEPTMQGEFLIAAMTGLRRRMEKSGKRFTIGIQTCGYCAGGLFTATVKLCDFVFFDIKHTDPTAHLRYTGRSNAPILENLERLKACGVPFVARVPLIPAVNDTPENMEATAALLEGASNLLRVELLPYNMAAGAKYRMVGAAGMKYAPDFTEGKPRIITEPFERRNIKAVVL